MKFTPNNLRKMEKWTRKFGKNENFLFVEIYLENSWKFVNFVVVRTVGVFLDLLIACINVQLVFQSFYCS